MVKDDFADLRQAYGPFRKKAKRRMEERYYEGLECDLQLNTSFLAGTPSLSSAKTLSLTTTELLRSLSLEHIPMLWAFTPTPSLALADNFVTNLPGPIDLTGERLRAYLTCLSFSVRSTNAYAFEQYFLSLSDNLSIYNHQ